MSKIKEEIMWAVYGTHGLYVGTAHTRKQMKNTHMTDLGYTDWNQCKEKGDKCIKVKVTPLNKGNKT